MWFPYRLRYWTKVSVNLDFGFGIGPSGFGRTLQHADLGIREL